MLRGFLGATCTYAPGQKTLDTLLFLLNPANKCYSNALFRFKTGRYNLRVLAKREGAILVLIDMQPNFLRPIEGAEKVLARCSFMLEIAALLEVPVIATEQYPSRMGGTDERLLSLLGQMGVMPLPKMSFSCAGCQDFVRTLGDTDLGEVVLIGIETHICVSQTAHYLLEDRVPVIIGADAVGARKSDMHEIGLERMEAAGAVLAHTESIAYEWLKSAEHPKFREALQIVKKYA